jgi:hypothetical protein
LDILKSLRSTEVTICEPAWWRYVQHPKSTTNQRSGKESKNAICGARAWFIALTGRDPSASAELTKEKKNAIPFHITAL